MVRLTVSSTLAGLLAAPGGTPTLRKTVLVEATNWRELTENIEERFPALAGRVFTEGAQMSPGFVVVVNDEVVQRPPESFKFGADDEVYVFAAVAGGCGPSPQGRGVEGFPKGPTEC